MKGLYTVLLLVCSNIFMTFCVVRTFKVARDESDQQLAAHRCYPDIVGNGFFSSIRSKSQATVSVFKAMADRLHLFS